MATIDTRGTCSLTSDTLVPPHDVINMTIVKANEFIYTLDGKCEVDIPGLTSQQDSICLVKVT